MNVPGKKPLRKTYSLKLRWLWIHLSTLLTHFTPIWGNIIFVWCKCSSMSLFFSSYTAVLCRVTVIAVVSVCSMDRNVIIFIFKGSQALRVPSLSGHFWVDLGGPVDYRGERGGKVRSGQVITLITCHNGIFQPHFQPYFWQTYFHSLGTLNCSLKLSKG